MKILGFSGRKKGGKTTAAEYVYGKVSGEREARIVPFAKELKEFTSMVFGIDYLDTDHRSHDWDKQEFKGRLHPCGKTYRELLQSFGTDYCRKMWPDIWIYHWEKNIAHVCPRCGLILVPDVRFPNELKAIQERGGHVIRLLRTPQPEDNHESETALDAIEFGTPQPDWYLRHGMTEVPRVPMVFDHVVDNRKMSQDQMCETVWQLVDERGWV
jgi:hypothetical protein